MSLTSRMKYSGLVLASGLVTGLAGSASADQVIADDLIVQGSACIGFDCVNGESFGSDTLRLKENNLRIHFDDTSNTASFPSNDWRIVANETLNGGANYLGIEDSTAGRTPFRVEAGAPNHTLYVEADGDVGVKTNNPAVDIHIVEGNTPTLRLEQDGSDGFTPQTYDVAANEANFFIRDVTNGSRLFFRAKPGAPADSLFIDSDGDVGIGTDGPAANLHVRDTVAVAQPMFMVENTNTTGTASNFVEFSGRTTGTNLLISDDDGRAQLWLEEPMASTSELKMELGSDVFDISFNGTGSSEFQIQRASGDVRVIRGNLEIVAGGLISTGGGGACTVADPCDAVFDPELYTVPSIEEHAALMWENKHLPAVGPTGPGIPINVTEKMLRMLNELEHAHIYIEQLHTRVAQLETHLIEY